MKRVANGTQATALPAAAAISGTPGYFTDGNPGTGPAGTVVDNDWLNGVQESLIGDGQFVRVVANQNVIVPAWATRARNRMWGPGGGAGSSANANSAGAAGGGGAYLEILVSGLVGLASIACLVGAGGAGGTGTSPGGAGLRSHQLRDLCLMRPWSGWRLRQCGDQRRPRRGRHADGGGWRGGDRPIQRPGGWPRLPERHRRGRCARRRRVRVGLYPAAHQRCFHAEGRLWRRVRRTGRHKRRRWRHWWGRVERFDPDRVAAVDGLRHRNRHLERWAACACSRTPH